MSQVEQCKEFACQCRRLGFNPWVRKIPWRRKWKPTAVFLPEKFHGHRTLAGYSPWGCKEHRIVLSSPLDDYTTIFLFLFLQTFKLFAGNSLGVQWLGLHAYTAEGLGSIPGRGVKILRATWHGHQKKKKKKRKKSPVLCYYEKNYNKCTQISISL